MLKDRETFNILESKYKYEIFFIKKEISVCEFYS